MGFGGWAWASKRTYVFSSQALNALLPCITITNDDPCQFIDKMKDRQSHKDIWLLGGAELAKSFSKEKLINEIILTIAPQILGDGIALGLNLDNFELSSEKFLVEGIVQKIYLRKG